MEKFVINLSSDEEFIKELIEPLIETEGFELVKIKITKSHANSTILLFLDKLEADQHITVDNLEFLSRYIGDVLLANSEKSPILNTQYNLEVSSPGLDRPLCKLSHFKNALEKKIKVRTNSYNLVGKLLKISNDAIILEDGSQKLDSLQREKSISFNDINSAQIVYEFKVASRKNQKISKVGESQ